MRRPYQRRTSTRVNIVLEAELKMGGSVSLPGHLSNISLNGMFLCCDARLPVGTSCLCTVTLVGIEPPVTIRMQGEVVRHEVSGMAIRFREIMGMDSLDHLCRVIMLNSGEAIEAVEQELMIALGSPGG